MIMRITSRCAAIPFLLALACPIDGTAQVNPPQQFITAGNQLRLEQRFPELERLATDLTPSFSPIGSTETVFQLSGTVNDKSVDAKIGLFSNGISSLVLNASGPIDKSIGGTVFADLDGLRPSHKIGLSFGQLLWNPRLLLDPETNTTQLETICTAVGIDPNTSPNCNVDYIEANHPSSAAAAIASVEIGNPVRWGVSIETGVERFAYLDPVTLVTAKENKTPFALKGGLSKLWTDSQFWLGASYRLESSYKPGGALPSGGGKTTVCRALGEVEGAQRCDEAVLGGPGEARRRSLTSISGRWFLDSGVAVSLKAHRDFTEDRWGFELPIFFLQQDGKGLTGGVSLGLTIDRTDPSGESDEVFAVQFFVGPALGFDIF